MLGEYLDTKLLMIISHSRNLLTEDQIEAESEKPHTLTLTDFEKFSRRLNNKIDWYGKEVFDVACGKGDLANSLAKNGASKVWGLDIQRHHINIARSTAEKEGITNVHFVQEDFAKLDTKQKFDYVLTYEALDHIPNVDATLEKMSSLLKDGGRIINYAAGFWLSPSADHCGPFFKVFIPWRHLLFSEKVLLNVRREKYRPTDPATRFEDIRGGLSKLTYSNYRRAIHDAGLEVESMEINFQLKEKLGGILYPLSYILVRLPIIGEYFTFSTLAILKKSKLA